MSSAYSLPCAYPSFGSQEDRPLAFLIPHLRVLQRCPIRSLFRIVGSSGSMDGGINILLSTTALIGDFVSHRAWGAMEQPTDLRKFSWHLVYNKNLLVDKWLPCEH